MLIEPSARSLFVIFSVFSVALAVHPIEVVSPEYMPPPWLDTASLCHPSISSHSHHVPSAVCDPSSLLSKRHISRLGKTLDRIYTASSPYSLVSCPESSSDTPHGFRVAIALVRRMAFDGRTLSERATNFVNVLFNNWRLDQNCGASVLLFLSIDDRRIFIRTGRLAVTYLTENQIDDIYSTVIPKLEKKQTFSALETAVSKIASHLSEYRGKPGKPGQSGQSGQSGGPAVPRNSDDLRTGASVPLFFRGGPQWWDLELSIVLVIAIFLLVLACCNGIGGPEAARKKRERRHVLRKLDLLRSEYMAAMLPQYAPLTCPYCQNDLSLPWEPTVPTLSSTTVDTQSSHHPVPDIHYKPTRTLRCSHTFHESCFDDEHPGSNSYTPECPVCKDRGGDTSFPPSLSSTRRQDFSFRLNRLHEEYPHIITSEILETLESEDPSTWPETMTEAYLRRSGNRRAREQGEASSGGWWSGVGGALAAGGIGALLASMLGRWNWGRRGEDGSSYTGIPSENGGHVGRWGDTNGTQIGGGGHGAGWGNSLSDAASRLSGGGGLGQGWGGGGFGRGWGGGGFGRSWGFGGSGGGNYGGSGGGGHGTGW